MVVALIAGIAHTAFLLYFFVLWGRFIVDLVRGINHAWRPRGFVLVVIEAVYVITDPPIKFFRRIMPPLSLGQVSFDFGWTLTMLCCIIGMSIAGAF
ncbi:YggT family protein [Leifsonia psychrotolerans]|uniref:YggT family protein n=1 Tax=Glaciibacter psychrotolerans TaxID=670054 RepID=A0A7Z0EC15_9MICO|nr:YggT family protein [Leifsonia psychrotolerans]NYJ18825.1 YggT family protein [Leifsonia psychrotolerans]